MPRSIFGTLRASTLCSRVHSYRAQEWQKGTRDKPNNFRFFEYLNSQKTAERVQKGDLMLRDVHSGRNGQVTTVVVVEGERKQAGKQGEHKVRGCAWQITLAIVDNTFRFLWIHITL